MSAIDVQALVDAAAKKYGIPPSLAQALVHQESGGNIHAVSPVGAKGLTQLMPGTAASLGVNPNDPVQNLDGGMRYLAQQYKHFGSWDLALAAYNAGPGAVAKYGGVPPYAETQAYVKNIMAMAGHMGSSTLPAVPAQQGPASQDPSQAAPQGPSLASILQPGVGDPSTMSPQQQLLQPDAGLQATQNGVDTGAMLNQVTNTPIPLPATSAPTKSRGKADALPVMPDPTDNPHVPVTGLDGTAPMVTGVQNQHYPHLTFAAHTDWSHVNPYLLQTLQKIGEKYGLNISVISGYRSNTYSAAHGGFRGDPHSKGLAVDAYVNGHPIGDVIPPDVWAKYGIRSGATPNFYKGKSDPEHLDLVGMPVKGGRR